MDAEYHRNYYKQTREVRLRLKKIGTAERRDRNRKVVWDYLLTNPCVDCGESNPVVLEFDHVRGVKIKAISEMIRGFSVDKILAEIAKCEVRCANCHRIRTYNQQGWYQCLK